MVDEIDPKVGEFEVCAALERIVSSPEFKANHNSAEFLKYIVKETLQGRGDRLKGYAIAISALGRKADFDPQSNSIVRVQANRLRAHIDSYYAGPGAQESVRILLPIGTYQPSFACCAVASVSPALASATEEPIAVGETAPASGPTRPASPRIWVVAAFVFGLVVMAGAFVVLGYRPQVSPGLADTGVDFAGTPIVSIRSDPSDGGSEPVRKFADTLVVELEGRFSAFEEIEVRASAPLSPVIGGERADVDYLLAVASRDAGGGLADVTVRLSRAHSGTVVWTRTYESVDVRGAAARADIVADVSLTVADLYGVIDSDMRKRLETSGSSLVSRYGCALLSFDFIRARTSAARARALRCLEDDLRTDAHNPRESALLAIVLTRGYLDALADTNGRRDFDRALDLARTAYEGAPFRALSQYVYFLTRFYDDQFDEAFVAAEKAMALNPYASTIVAAIGSAYVSRGDYARGMQLLAPLAQSNSTAPIGFLSFAALAAYMQNDDKNLAKYAERPAMTRSAMGVLMRSLDSSCGLETSCVARCAQALVANFPGFAGDIPAALDRYAFAQPIKTRLLEDLKTSGLLAAVAAELRQTQPPAAAKR